LKLFVTIAAAGASVGAIHGVALLWLLRRRWKWTILSAILGLFPRGA
jgi:hypothetical protein